MKSIVPAAILMASLSFAFAGGKSGTYTGEIMDKQCADMQSHDAMMQPEGAHNARECTLKCAKDGGQLALFDQAAKKVYTIADVKKGQEYAGQRVKINGTYDSSTGTLNVESIAPLR
jgi:hypothetical protein